MIATVLLGLLACVTAVPQWDYDYYTDYGSSFGESLQRSINDRTQKYLDQMQRQLDRNMARVNNMVADIEKNIPKIVSREETVGNKYKIIVFLTGFEEKEINIKVETGTLCIEAVHRVYGQPDSCYLETRQLPACVARDQGNWTFENGVLTITFPMLTGESTDPAYVDLGKNKVINHNEEPKIEATTLTDNLIADTAVPRQY